MVFDSVPIINQGLVYHKWSLTRFGIEELMILKQGSLSNKRCC